MPLSIAAIILAAGSSSRMGRPKQLLPYGGETLLGQACSTALASVCDPVLVVIGSSADLIKGALTSLPVEIAENPHWERGLGASLKVGIQVIADRPEVSAALILLCDQPLVTSRHLDQLVDCYRSTGAPIVASAYSGQLGVPALFDRGLFPELLALEDGSGAKKLLGRDPGRVLSVPLEDGHVDVDTVGEYESLLSRTPEVPPH